MGIVLVWGGLSVSIIIQDVLLGYGGYKVALECNIVPVDWSL